MHLQNEFRQQDTQNCTSGDPFNIAVQDEQQIKIESWHQASTDRGFVTDDAASNEDDRTPYYQK